MNCCCVGSWRTLEKKDQAYRNKVFSVELDCCVLNRACKTVFYLLLAILMKLTAEFQILKNFKWKQDLLQFQNNTLWKLKFACLMPSFFSAVWDGLRHECLVQTIISPYLAVSPSEEVKELDVKKKNSMKVKVLMG